MLKLILVFYWPLVYLKTRRVVISVVQLSRFALFINLISQQEFNKAAGVFEPLFPNSIGEL